MDVQSRAAAEVAAGRPRDVSVTVYRAPDRSSGSFELDDLGGFALVSETRLVHLSQGMSRLRFEGVADGIEPVSAIVTGLPDGIVEKNREGRLLSPQALIEAAAGKPVVLRRTDRKTGKLTQIPVTIRSGAGGGVVLETPEGVEALRCSGLPEMLEFSGTSGLAASPTLSVLVRSPQEITKTVTLSYLARGFDWAANYTATLSADGTAVELGAWVTLANGNGVGFPAAHTQVVAGRLNRESGAVEPLDVGGRVLANCWPRGSTSDPPAIPNEDRMFKLTVGGGRNAPAMAMRAAAPQRDFMVTSQKVVEEQLGDLKLYRVPEPTDLAARQSKQVRLLDRHAIPVKIIYGADLAPGQSDPVPATVLLRTTNTAANHLGLPLPSGRVAVFAADESNGARTNPGGAAPLILRFESAMRDLAVDEEVEIGMGESADVRVAAVTEQLDIDTAKERPLPSVPGVTIRSTPLGRIERVDLTNARAREVSFELRLQLPEGARVVRADHPLGSKNGRPIFRLILPAESAVTIRYQTQTVVSTIQRGTKE